MKLLKISYLEKCAVLLLTGERPIYLYVGLGLGVYLVHQWFSSLRSISCSLRYLEFIVYLHGLSL